MSKHWEVFMSIQTEGQFGEGDFIISSFLFAKDEGYFRKGCLKLK